MIPKQIKVGKMVYKVEYADDLLDDRYAGEVRYDDGVITICKQASFTTHAGTEITMKYSPEEMQAVFWHEMTHAILKDMGHHLHNNEHFVEAFSSRLTDAINSAKL
jgi:hypothetical protein